MPKRVEEFLKMLYPDLDSLTPEEKLQYKKDKEFLKIHKKSVKKIWEKYKNQINKSEIADYAEGILELAKREYDPETIIVNYASGMLEALDKNNLAINDFDFFMQVMNYNKVLEENCDYKGKSTVPIELDTVFSLTEEFLSQIDSSNALKNEFNRLRETGKIVILGPELGSIYSRKYKLFV